MKLVLLITRAAGAAALIGALVVGWGSPSSTHSQGFTSDGVPAAKLMSVQVSTAEGISGNLINSADRSMCIDADSNHYPHNGDNIQLWSCNTNPEQKWVVTSAGQLKNASTNMCVDADSNHYPHNGDNIQLWSCNTNPEQKWVVTSAGQLKNASTNMCVDADSNHYPHNGDNIQLWSCNTNPEQRWMISSVGAGSEDWAGSSFCASYEVRYMGTTYNGVAACGDGWTGASSNEQGPITYNGVLLDSVGFQCYELAARYFYYATGYTPPVDPRASNLAWDIHNGHSQFPVFPAGATGATSTYSSSLVQGAIISMWSASDLTGHVGVVTKVSLTNNSGLIYVMDENSATSGTDKITVTNGQMNFENLYNKFQWVTGL